MLRRYKSALTFIVKSEESATLELLLHGIEILLHSVDVWTNTGK
jgi:hypothetical protein